jgi:hypothetical protein
MKVGNRFFVSNSLACLAALTASRADPIYPRYYEDFCSIVTGIHNYKRTIPSNTGYHIQSESGPSYSVPLPAKVVPEEGLIQV